MARLVLPLVLFLFACSASKAPEDPSADADPSAAETRDPSDDDDGADAGEGDSPDEGDSDEGAGDTDPGGADPGDPGDTGASDTGGAPGGEDTSAGADPGPDGAALYASHCAACHGPDGHGTDAAPDIVGDVEGESDAGLIDLIQNGKDGMPAQDVTDEEAQAIVDWMRAGF